jgi:hypothetical protein
MGTLSPLQQALLAFSAMFWDFPKLISKNCWCNKSNWNYSLNPRVFITQPTLGENLCVYTA